MKTPEFYCRQCKEVNPPDSGAFDYTSSPSGRTKTYTPTGGPWCMACWSEDIVPYDDYISETEYKSEE